MQASPEGIGCLWKRPGDFLGPISTISFVTLGKSPLHPVTTGLNNFWVHFQHKHFVTFMSEEHFFPTMRLKSKNDSVLSTSAKCPCPLFAPVLANLWPLTGLPASSSSSWPETSYPAAKPSPWQSVPSCPCAHATYSMPNALLPSPQCPWKLSAHSSWYFQAFPPLCCLSIYSFPSNLFTST